MDNLDRKYFDMVIALVRTISDSDLKEKFKKHFKELKSEARRDDGDNILKDLFPDDPPGSED